MIDGISKHELPLVISKVVLLDATSKVKVPLLADLHKFLKSRLPSIERFTVSETWRGEVR